MSAANFENPHFLLTEEHCQSINAAAGAEFNQGEWTSYWCTCDGFISGGLGSIEEPLSVADQKDIMAIKIAAEALVNAIAATSWVTQSRLQVSHDPNQNALMQLQTVPGIFAAQPPHLTSRLTPPTKILEWAKAAEKTLQSTPKRRQGQNNGARNVVFLTDLEKILSWAGERLTNARKPNLTGFVTCTFDLLPETARSRLQSPEAALKSLQRYRAGQVHSK